MSTLADSPHPVRTRAPNLELFARCVARWPDFALAWRRRDVNGRSRIVLEATCTNGGRAMGIGILRNRALDAHTHERMVLEGCLSTP